MTIAIRRFQPEDVAAIDRFNSRVAARGVQDRIFPESPTQRRGTTAPVTQRLFVAVDEGEIRGGVWLHEHDFRVGASIDRLGWANYPVAESLIDRAYSGVPGGLVFHLLRVQPKLMALGMGGHGGALARLLAYMKWQGHLVPSYVLPVRPLRVLRMAPYLHRTPIQSLIVWLAAWSGFPTLAMRLLRGVRKLRVRGQVGGHGEVVPRFGAWADAIWEAGSSWYGLVARRDAVQLNELYPLELTNLHRLRIRRGGRDLGWACSVRSNLSDTPDSRFLGNLTVGMLADAFAAPEDALPVCAAATEHLISSGVDLILSNQTHPAWGRALLSLGYLNGPSNFALYCSPKTTAALGTSGVTDSIFVNRGDCDGPPWLKRSGS